MKERGILFSAPMVRALLAGTKTQTRRAVKTSKAFVDMDATPSDAYDVLVNAEGFASFLVAADHGYTDPIACPYGAPGDRLYVKETWRSAIDLDKLSPVQIGERAIDAGYSKPWAPLKYEADNVERDRQSLRDFGDAWGKTRVAIHMPRWASRITLEVTEVRAQRLHEITADDARAEGCGSGELQDATINGEPGRVAFFDPRTEFAHLWAAINGDGSWKANPWVWAITFKRVEELCHG